MIASAIKQIVNTDRAGLKNFFMTLCLGYLLELSPWHKMSMVKEKGKEIRIRHQRPGLAHQQSAELDPRLMRDGVLQKTILHHQYNKY
jgi:hypothetical protein